MTSDGTYNYTYDSEGNRTRKTTISGGAYVDYVWDYHNRLTDVKSYTSGGTLLQRIHYTYDVADRLIGRQIDTNGDGTYDAAARYVNDWSTAPRTNGAPNGLGIGTGLDATLFAFNGSGTMTNRYLSGPAVDQVFADENAAGTIFWDLADNEGTIRDVAQYNSGTNTTTVVNHLKYDSFGNITAQSDSTKQPLFVYTGRQWDSEAGLQYTRARWYDPKAGRFISEDPSSFAGGDINLSRYVDNSPVLLTDPSGLNANANMYTGGYAAPPKSTVPVVKIIVDKPTFRHIQITYPDGSTIDFYIYPNEPGNNKMVVLPVPPKYYTGPQIKGSVEEVPEIPGISAMGPMAPPGCAGFPEQPKFVRKPPEPGESGGSGWQLVVDIMVEGYPDRPEVSGGAVLILGRKRDLLDGYYRRDWKRIVLTPNEKIEFDSHGRESGGDSP